MNHEYTSKFLERFWSRVDCTAGLFECWVWMASVGSHGYGQINYNSEALLAHRISYEIAYGPFPSELHVLHKCDNRPCCNPQHLFLGTPRDNMIDMHQKGRANPPRGDMHVQHKLTDAQVAEIRRIYPACGKSQRALAKTYGVSERHIFNILHHKKRR